MDIRKTFTNYMNETLSDVKDREMLYLYERQLLEKMQLKAENAKKAGLSDEKVLTDLVISHYSDLMSDYKEFYINEKQKAKEKAQYRLMGWTSLIMLAVMLIGYFAISFTTKRWEETWLIIIFFVTLWLDSVIGLAVKKLISMKKIFHVPARIIAGLGMMMTTTLVFLTSLVYFRFENYWIIYPAGVFCIYIVDAIIAHKSKQRMRFINYLVYIPAAMPMLYVVLGGLHVIPWDPGWLLMPLSVIIDLLVVLGIYINHRKYVYKPEEETQ